MIREICFENIGPLKSGCIELSKLTVITGPQNSGKTYLASLTYFAYKEIYRLLAKYVTAIAATSFFQYAMDVGKSDEGAAKEDILERAVQKTVEAGLKILAEELGSKILNTFPGYFACGRLDELIHRGGGKASLNVKIDSGEVDIVIKRGETPTIDTTKLEAAISKGILNIVKSLIDKAPLLPEVYASLAKYSRLTEREPLSSEKYFKYTLEMIEFFTEFSGEIQVKTALYVPAERIVVVPSFYATMSMLSALHESPGKRLVEMGFKIRTPILDYLTIVSAALSRGIEGELPGGVGRFHIREGKVYYVDLNGWEFPIEVTSSGVSQLVGLTMPLIHIGVENIGLLIIEEPELNLHADLHLSVADFISQLSTITRVLVTTHSEYVLSGIGLNIRRGVLKREDVKAYFLKDGTVRELKVNEEGDIELPETIAETIGEISEELLRW